MRTSRGRRTVLITAVALHWLMLTGNPASHTVASFHQGATYSSGDGPVNVAVGLLNADAHLDVVTTNFFPSRTASVLLGNGDGTFQPRVSYEVGHVPYGLTLADVVGDSALDLVATTRDDHAVSVLRGRGDGTFEPAVSYSTGPGPVSVIAADFNSDDHLDLATGNLLSGGSVSVLLGTPAGSFQPAMHFPTGAYSYEVVAGDFDGDSVLDLATANLEGDSLSVLRGVGDGTFQPLTTVPVSSPLSVATADVDGDEVLDLIAASTESNATVVFRGNGLLGRGDGTFQAGIAYAVGAAPGYLQAVDLDEDTFVDLIVPNQNDNTVSILRGRPGGAFDARVDYAVGVIPIAARSGDFNADGALDVAVSSFSSGTVTILLSLRPQSISFSALSDRVYSNAPFELAATASSGLPVTFSADSDACTVSGATVTLTATGPCAVTAHQPGDGVFRAARDVSRTFTIAPATAVLTLSNLQQEADGTPKSVTVTTDPPGLAGVEVTYDGASSLPVAAGTYSIVATLNHPLYHALDATGTLVLTPNEPPVINIVTPAAGGLYAQGTLVRTQFICSDVSSPVVRCETEEGQLSGGILDTSTTGTRVLRVVATDAAGNMAMGSVLYTVTPGPIDSADLWVTHDRQVSVFDTTTNRIRSAIPFGGRPFGVAFSPDGRRAYVTDSDHNLVRKFDTGTWAELGQASVGRQPVYVTTTGDGRRVVVVNHQDWTVSVVDADSMTTLHAVSVGVGPWGITTVPGSGEVWVANTGDGTISVLDADATAVIASIPVGANPQMVAVNSAGSRAYAIVQRTGHLLEIDTATRGVLREIDVVDNAHTVSLTPDNSQAYVSVAAVGGTTLHVVDLAAGRTAAAIGAGIFPSSSATAANGPRAFVAGAGTGTLFVIDTSTQQSVHSIRLGQEARAAAVTPLPTRFSSMAVETGHYGGSVGVSATLSEGRGGLADRVVSFAIRGQSVGIGLTNQSGNVSQTLPLGPLAVGTHPVALNVAFRGDRHYAATAASRDLQVAPGIPSVSWDPAPLEYGQTIGAAQTNVVADMDGRFDFTLPDGNPLAAGDYPASVTFTPTDPNFAVTTINRTITVVKAVPSMSIYWPPKVYDGALHGVYIDTIGVFGEGLLPATSSFFRVDPAGETRLATAPTLAGSYRVEVHFAGNNNYRAITGTAESVIAPAVPAVVVESATVTYDGQPHTVNARVTGPVGDLLPFTIRYRLNSSGATTEQPKTLPEDPSHDEGDPMGGEAAPPEDKDAVPEWTDAAPVEAGVYDVEATYAGDANHVGATGLGQLAIQKAAAAVWVTPLERRYDGNPHPTMAFATGVGGENLGDVPVDYDPGPDPPVDAGIYTATGRFAGSRNYEAAVGSNQVAIVRATPTLNLAPETFTYDGRAHGAAQATATGVLGEALPVSLMYLPGLIPPVDAGVYSVLLEFSGSTNYEPASATALLIIRPARPTIAMTGGTFGYDGLPHAATATVTGVDGGALGPVSIRYLPGPGTPVDAGVYIAEATYAGSQNYEHVVAEARMIINRGGATVVVQGGTFIYDGDPHPATGSARGINGEDLGPLTFTYNGAGTLPRHAGDYAVVGSFAGTANYEPASATTGIHIAPAPLDIAVAPASRIYGLDNPTFTLSYSGFVGGDGTSSLTTPPAVSTIATAQSPVGTYPITVTGASSPDYQIRFYDASLTITQAMGAVVLSSSAHPAGYLQPFALRADVRPEPTGGGVATGTVEFLADGVSIGTATVLEGVAVVNTVLEPGAHVVLARYTGDINVSPSVAELNQTVNDRNESSVTTLDVKAVAFSADVSLTVKVTAPSATPSGWVDIFDGQLRRVEIPIAKGAATVNTILPPGVHVLTARYRGDGVVTPSVSSPVVHTVAASGELQHTSIKLSPKTVKSGETVRVDVRISGSGSPPIGKVKLYLDDQPMGESDLVALSASDAGAFFELPPQPPESTHRLTAIYVGSPRHAGASESVELHIGK